MPELLIFAIAAFLSYVLVIYIRRGTRRWRLIDLPNERSSHTQPTPKGGGVAIALITLLGIALALLLGGTTGAAPVIYLASGTVIALLGLVDDIYNLRSTYRLLLQAAIAVFVVMSVGYWTVISLPVVGTVSIGVLGAVVAVVWVVGLVNAYNFMDGTDGMAGGVGLVASLGWVLLPWPSEMRNIEFLRLVGLLLAGTSLGFLGHNWSPAKIFMGDVGSTFMGFSLAFFALLAADQPQSLLVGALLVWPFLFDTIFTFFRRMKNGENVLAAHRSHLYQRLVIAGYSHPFVGVLYGLYTAVGVILAWLWLAGVPGAGLAIIGVIPALCIAHLTFVARRQRVLV